ncbi:MAG: hypothetical protein A3E01_17035 [Gammaproteobacteria bacterium RIFCSPHIGHO2_12_FULL_63_22]|nr:MAG: hypothetical protein A3E01_17035 [Gammaproteobacteria bacterium RIFCSPHIGHO2_12_FULL_63_22]
MKYMKPIKVLMTMILAGTMLAACGEAPVDPAIDAAAKAQKTAYEKEIADWRAGRLQRLTKPDGWLSLVGMHWLEVGKTRVGNAADNGTRLAVGPPKIGLVGLDRDGNIEFTPESGVEILIDGQPATGPVKLVSDADGTPTVVGFNKGDASFIVIKRGGKYALRVRDALAPTRMNFPGIPSFDIDPSFRFNARFTAHPPGKKIDIVNILSMVEPMDNPGTVTFEKDGKSFTLEAVDEGDHQLFLIYADRTSGHESYPAARFLYAEYPDANGMTVVDFNKGYNPPCAFSEFSTCPMPPLSNRLDLVITAGEKKPYKPGAAVAN